MAVSALWQSSVARVMQKEVKKEKCLKKMGGGLGWGGVASSSTKHQQLQDNKGVCGSQSK